MGPLQFHLQKTHSHRFFRLQQLLLTSMLVTIRIVSKWLKQMVLVAPVYCRRNCIYYFIRFICLFVYLVSSEGGSIEAERLSLMNLN